MDNMDRVTKRDILLINKLIDNELSEHDEAKLLARIAKSPELKALLYRYQLIKAMQNNDPIVPADFAEKCRQRIEQEEITAITLTNPDLNKPNSKSA